MKLSAVLLTFAVAAAAVPAGTAYAEPYPGPDGARCGVATVNDPATGKQTGVMWGGPVVATVPGGVASGSLSCKLTTSPTHVIYDISAYAATPVPMPGVVVLQPTPISFEDPSAQLYLCSQFSYQGGWNIHWDAARNAWDTSNEVPCQPVTRREGGYPDAGLNALLCPVVSLVPVVATTLRNLLGCNSAPGSVVPGTSYVALPET